MSLFSSALIAVVMSFALADEPAPPRPPLNLSSCTGLKGNTNCEFGMEFASCKQSIRLTWKALAFPGDPKFAQNYRNWCDVTFSGIHRVERKQYPPEACSKLVAIFAEGLQSFPDVVWETPLCSVKRLEGHGVLSVKAPMRRVVELEDASGCLLDDSRRKAKVLRCPVLPPSEQEWFQKLVTALSIKLVVKNPVK
jgi:hypothetical protein